MSSLLLLAGGAASAAAQPPQGAPLLVFVPEEVHLGGERAEAGQLEVVALQDFPGVAPAGQRALRVRTRRPLSNFWKLEVARRIEQPVQKHQPILVRFFARALSPAHKDAPPRTTVYFQRSGEPWDKSLTVNVKLPAKWKRYEIPFRAHDSFAAGEALLCFGFGFEPQTVELAGVECLAFPANTDIDSLPRSR